MDSSAINRGKRRSPRRIFLYGVRGIGKSTWASMAERPVFVSTEDGLDDIECDSLPECRSYADVIDRIGFLYSSEHSYATAVVDSADWLERHIHAEVCRIRGVNTIEDIGFKKGYTFAMPLWQEVLNGLAALRRDRGMTIIFIAHAEIEKFNNPETDGYDRYVPRLHELASDMLQDWCDEVLFTNYKVFTTSTDEGFGKKRIKAATQADRFLYTAERPTHLAKNRLNLPSELALDYREFAKYLAVGSTPEATPA